jgi:hypothetical protein
MLREITKINRETVHEILVEYLTKNKVRAHFAPHLLMAGQNHQPAASSVESEFLEMINDDTNVSK